MLACVFTVLHGGEWPKTNLEFANLRTLLVKRVP